MARRRLIWQLFPTYLLVPVVALIAITGYTTQAVQRFYHTHVKEDLSARVQFLLPQVERLLITPEAQTGDYSAIDTLCKGQGRLTDTRITVVLPDGTVVGDSAEAPDSMENHQDRPEIRTALDGALGESERFSDTLGEPLLYVARALRPAGAPIAVVRTAMPLTALQQSLHSVYRNIALGGVVVALLAAILSWLVARRIMRPLEVMKHGAEQFAQGKLNQMLPRFSSEEVGGLSDAMNKMATQLNDRINTIVRQHNEQQAVLASMVESVLAVDEKGRIISLNKAAGRLLEVDPLRVQGESLQVAVRNTALQEFTNDALEGPDPIEREIVLSTRGEQVLQAHGTALRDEDGRRIGAVVVLNDVTRLRRLEKVRSEFVANVSHELKTPITSIKGYVETLQDGALERPEDAKRFLAVVARHADRINNIIEDLLALCRLEQENTPQESLLELGCVDTVVRSAAQFCDGAAREKGITLEVQYDARMEARIHPQLLETAIVNLIDNAIKYSEPATTVTVDAKRVGDEAMIRVVDQGYGIASEHLPRLFERFYRVDQARSRQMGGTGLGLAITKHVAQVHGGRVEVQSRTGVGSSFYIYIPLSAH